MSLEGFDLCPGCDTELPASQYCERCECFGWQHCIITLDQARELHGSQLTKQVERDLKFTIEIEETKRRKAA